MVRGPFLPPLLPIRSEVCRAVVTGKDSSFQSVGDLKGQTFGISRLGSGSQVMASVLGMNEGWVGDAQPQFKGMSKGAGSLSN